MKWLMCLLDKWTAKEYIVFALTIMVVLVICLPVLGLVITEFIYGRSTTERPEFLKFANDVVIYVLGIISGYVLNTRPTGPTNTPPNSGNPPSTPTQPPTVKG